MRGRITHFKDEKSYGFIQAEDYSVDVVFMHLSDCRYSDPKPGDHVEFAEGEIRDGRVRAEDVRLIQRLR